VLFALAFMTKQVELGAARGWRPSTATRWSGWLSQGSRLQQRAQRDASWQPLGHLGCGLRMIAIDED
jgi:hypothetical protein